MSPVVSINGYRMASGVVSASERTNVRPVYGFEDTCNDTQNCTHTERKLTRAVNVLFRVFVDLSRATMISLRLLIEESGPVYFPGTNITGNIRGAEKRNIIINYVSRASVNIRLS